MRLALMFAAAAALLAGLVALTRRSAPPGDLSPARIVVVPAGEERAASGRAGRPAVAASAPAAATPATDDRAWAEFSENVVRVQLRQVPMLDVGDNLRISCAVNRCVATGRLPAGLQRDNRAMYWGFIQGPAVRERMTELRLPLGEARLGPDDRFVVGFARAP